MESKIVELRERGRRASRTAMIALGVGAAVGVVVVGVFVAYRLTRPASTRERLRRLVPDGVADLARDLGHARRAMQQGLRRQLPPVRLYVGDRQVGEDPPATQWERIAVRAAQAGGTALAGALASRLLTEFTTRRGRS
jgi:hypothetical protein